MTPQKRTFVGIAAAAAACLLLIVPAAVHRFADQAPPPNVEGGEYGWAGPDAVRDAKPIVDRLPQFRILHEPGVSYQDGPRNVRLWLAEKKLGARIPNVKQQRGDCVSWGYRNGVARLLCVALATGSARGEFHDPYAPYFYGTSRVFEGGGRLSGDGSVGAWAQEAVKKWGVLASDAPGVPAYSAAVAGQWGKKPGPPQQFVDLAKAFRVETTAVMRSADDVAAAISNGYPVPICSDFGTRTFRTADGRLVAKGDGSWNHCMCLLAYDESAPSGERYFYCLNSWGEDAHPRPLGDEPAGGFWLTWSQVDRIARQGDSFALSNFRGFPARKIDFRIFANTSTAKEGGTHASNPARGSFVRGPALRRGFYRGERFPLIRRVIVDEGDLVGRPAAVVRPVGAGRPADDGIAAGTGGVGDGGLACAEYRRRGRAVFARRTGLRVPGLAAAGLGVGRLAGDLFAAGLDAAGVVGRLPHDGRVDQVADRELDPAAVPRAVLHGTELPQLQAVRIEDDPRAREERLDRRPGPDLAFAGDRRNGGRAGGDEGAVREVRGDLRPYPDPYFSRGGSGADRWSEGVDGRNYGRIRPSDAAQGLRPLDGERPFEVDAGERSGEGIFGPSEGQLRDLADRAVDRLTSGAEDRLRRAAAAKGRQALKTAACGCAIAGGAAGGVLGGVLAFLKVAGFVVDLLRKRREKKAEASEL